MVTSGSVTAPGRRPFLPPAWPLSMLILGFPLWWVLGLSAFIWPIMAVPMALWLVRRRAVYVPKGFGIWLGFLLWMFASATRLDDSSKYFFFGYRASLYVSATIILLYVFNMPRETLPDARVIRLMAIFWIYVVAGGLLGVFAPTLTFTSPMETVLPGRFTSNEFLHLLVHPATSQLHDFLGYLSPRPQAPFVYANIWGATFGLLVPFVILAWKYAGTRRWKVITGVVFVAAIVPLIHSLDRGLWLSLGVGLVYAAVRQALAGRAQALRTILLVILTVLVVVYLTPLKTLVSDRFAHPHSNEGRLNLYQESVQVMFESPLLGYGSPLPSSDKPTGPQVGTQGQLWMVLVSQGIPGLILFMGWFLFQFWRLRWTVTDVGFWCHTLILIALIQAPFYDWLGAPLVVIMVAIALANRDLIPSSSTSHARVTAGATAGGDRRAPDPRVPGPREDLSDPLAPPVREFHEPVD
jgi:polysaccharide biosynthesis protein PslJ